MKFYTYVGVVGNDVLYRYIENGEHYTETVKYQPTLFATTSKHSDYKTLHDQMVAPLYLPNIKAARDKIKEMQDVVGYNIYGTKHYDVQFIRDAHPGNVKYDPSKIRGHLIDIEVHREDGFPNPSEALWPVTGITVYDTVDKRFVMFAYHETDDYVHNPDHPVVGDLPVDVFNFNSELHLMTSWVHFMQSRQPDWWSGWNSEGFDVPYLVNRVKNLFGEDKLRELSPFRMKPDARETRDDWGNRNTVYQIRGVPHLDYMHLYKTHTFVTQEKYTLDHIGYVELDETKLEYDGTLADLYNNDFQLYMEYNLQDVNLLKRLEEKKNLFPVTYALAYFQKVNYVDTLATVKPWEALMYNRLMDKNIVPPMKANGKKDRPFAGAYVMPPTMGIKEWVVSCDLNSMYPHLIQQYNLGPDTIIEDEDLPVDIQEWRKTFVDIRDDMADLLKREPHPVKEDVDPINDMQTDRLIRQSIDTSILEGRNICMTANGQFFKTDKMSILSETMRELYSTRKAKKKEMLNKEQQLVIAKTEKNMELAAQLEAEIDALDNMQMALKICLNSGYGAIGNPHFCYFDLRVAEAITLGGQYAIKYIGFKADDYLNNILGTDKRYTVYTDTDSVYIECKDLVERFCQSKDELDIVKFLDTVFEQKIVPYMGRSYEESAAYMHAYENRMFMAREVISPRSMWTAKKRYIMDVWNSEGVQYDKPKLKVMGLEAVRSTTPELMRNKLKEVYKLILNSNNDTVIEFIENFKEEYFAMPIERIALGSGCNGLLKYASNSNPVYIKGTPKHVKGALIYNNALQRLGLDTVYEPIKEAEKIHYVELKLPNKLGEEVVAFNSKLPQEFNVHAQVDKELMFNKSFTKALDNMLTTINWTTERVFSLDAFM